MHACAAACACTKMAGNLVSSLLSLATSLLPTIGASAHAQSPPLSSPDSEKKDRRAVEADLKRLMRTLERIKAVLYDAEDREIKDRSVKLWLKELKKVAFSAEDLLSEYRHEVARVQVEARMASGSHKREQIDCIVQIPDGMVKRLEKIRNRFDEIAKDREALQLRESDGTRRLNRILRPPAGHMVDETSILGRDVEVMKVINLILSNQEKPFSLVSIIGKGGLGKTTIAQLVYKNERFCGCFDLKVWTCASEEFDVKGLSKAIIESVTKDYCIASELSPLQEQLANIVKGKSLLLVLDDVWNENRSLWELFLVPFNKAKLMRILVTTRNDKVAQVMQSSACLKPPYLPESSSWQLFEHYAFGGTSYIVPTHFIEMGREIMRKCGGLPLAIKSIASLLRHEADEESWREILESDLWESNPSNDIFPALHISYTHLPVHLKPCFLFCSMYPKDYLLKKKKLIQLWISHGYIEPRGKKTLIEIGAEYYKELKERSFFDDFSNEYSEVQCMLLDDFSNEYLKEQCKLHDIIHDLARFISEREHCSIEIDPTHDIDEAKIPQIVYHLYIRGLAPCVDRVLQKKLKGLRTLSLDLRDHTRTLEHQYSINSTKAIDLNLKFLEALRVLELKWDSMTEISDSVVHLKHLSHLHIISHELKKLPESLGLLFNLQTFILDCYRSPLKCLPESTGNLVNLQSLCVACANFEELPKSLDLLANLLRLVIKCDKLEKAPLNIRKLCNLQVLTIDAVLKAPLLDAISSLSSLVKLQCPSMGTPSKLPSALGNFGNLKTLKIKGCSINYDPRGLNNFPSIRVMVACLQVRTIGWLRDMKDLEGDLIIEGLVNTSNLTDVQHANLRSKCKIESLELRWYDDHMHYGEGAKELRIRLIKEPDDESIVVGEDLNFGLLEYLQPHSHLKSLVLQGYPCAIIPDWIGHPFSLQVIQEIRLQGLEGLQSLPFRNLHTLKRLELGKCLGIQVLLLEQLPTQLEELKILWCHNLELITGLYNLKMLVVLMIEFCKALKSIVMDKVQLPESIEHFDNLPHEVPRDSWRSISSLEDLIIESCPLLYALPHDLIPSRPCKVWICRCGCPNLKIGY